MHLSIATPAQRFHVMNMGILAICAMTVLVFGVVKPTVKGVIHLITSEPSPYGSLDMGEKMYTDYGLEWRDEWLDYGAVYSDKMLDSDTSEVEKQEIKKRLLTLRATVKRKDVVNSPLELDDWNQVNSALGLRHRQEADRRNALNCALTGPCP